MTVVNVLVRVPSNGADIAATGSLSWTPTARRVTGGAIVLPASFRVDLVDGAATVEVEPSTGVWVWAVVEHFTGVPSKRSYFAVPTVGPVDYSALTEVDPATLDPTLPADPAWLAPLNELAAGTVTPDPGYPGFYLIGA